MKINPFELHPDTPELNRQIHNESITVCQLNEIIDELVIQLWTSSDKTWGWTRVEIEEWLRTVVHETEKVITKQVNQCN